MQLLCLQGFRGNGGISIVQLHLLSESECAFPQTPEQGSPHLILEGRCPAEFSLPQHTCLQVPSIPSKTLISCFRCLNRVGAKLCRTRPSRTESPERLSLHPCLFTSECTRVFYAAYSGVVHCDQLMGKVFLKCIQISLSI